MTFGYSFWIGVNDTEKEGTFVWSDGTKSGFHDFAENQPRFGDTDECIFLSAEGWEEAPCTERLQAYCQYELHNETGKF